MTVSAELKAMLIDERRVSDALYATGSSDPDILYARKEELLAATDKLRATGALTILWGVGLSLTIVGSAIGVPAVRRGMALRKCAAANARTIESAFGAYLARLAERRRTTQTRFR